MQLNMILIKKITENLEQVGYSSMVSVEEYLVYEAM